MLPAPSRLSGQDRFSRVFRQGRSVAHRAFLLRWIARAPDATHIGIIAGKKVFPRAIDRNHAKRFAREALRPLLSHIRSGYDIIVTYRYKPDRFVFREGTEDLEALLANAHLLKPRS